jgi:RND family efflux transporter MFP subunit
LLLKLSTASGQGVSTPVSVVKTANRPVYEEVPYTGDVDTRRTSRISPKVDGFVAAIYVEEGDEVRAGDKLLGLDPDLAEVALKRTAAELEEAHARQREAVRRRQEAAELVKKAHIASTAYEATKSEVEITAAAVERLQAEYQTEQIIVSRQTVYAPFDGLIAEKRVEVGEWVETGNALFDLVEIDHLRIEVAISQRHFAQIVVGAPVAITFDALPEQRFEGKVSVKIPVGQGSTRTFPVRISLSNEERLVAPGMSARVRIRLGKEGNSTLLPRDAVIRKADGSETVWVLQESEGLIKVKAVAVETGRAFGGNVEVLNGTITSGDRVVLRGNERLRPEQVVHITEEVELDPQ